MPKKPAKRAVKRTLWASRDKCSIPDEIEIWDRQPTLSDGEHGGGIMLAWFNEGDFRETFGFCPKPGQCIEFENTAKVVK